VDAAPYYIHVCCMCHAINKCYLSGELNSHRYSWHWRSPMYVVYQEDSSAQHGYGRLNTAVPVKQHTSNIKNVLCCVSKVDKGNGINSAPTAENTYMQEYSNIGSCFCFRRLTTASLTVRKAEIFDLFPVNQKNTHKQHHFCFKMDRFYII